MHAINLHGFAPFINGILFGLLAMVLHEIGHLSAAQALGLNVKRVGFSWKGMYTVREAGPPEISLQVALAGPLTNLALLPLGTWVPIFGVANLFCGLFNLLPIPGADGWRVLRCLRAMREARRPSQQSHALRRAGGSRYMTAKNALIQPLSRAGKQPSTTTPAATASNTSSVAECTRTGDSSSAGIT
jgi:hypothetical protein